MEKIDNWIKAVGYNPYLMTLGLVVTIGPVLFQICKISFSASRYLISILQIGLKRAAFLRRLHAIRGRVGKDEYGFFTKYQVSVVDLYILISKLFVMACYYLTSIAVLSLVLAGFSFENILVYLSLFTILSVIAGISTLRSELQAIMWRKKFQLKNFHRKKRMLEQLAASIAEQAPLGPGHQQVALTEEL